MPCIAFVLFGWHPCPHFQVLLFPRISTVAKVKLCVIRHSQVICVRLRCSLGAFSSTFQSCNSIGQYFIHQYMHICLNVTNQIWALICTLVLLKFSNITITQTQVRQNIALLESHAGWCIMTVHDRYSHNIKTTTISTKWCPLFLWNKMTAASDHQTVLSHTHPERTVDYRLYTWAQQ